MTILPLTTLTEVTRVLLFLFTLLTTSLAVDFVQFQDTPKLGITLDYAGCNSVFYDYPEAECHVDTFTANTTSLLLPGDVKQCCGFHGYFQFADCPGTGPGGQEVMVSNVQVCHMLDNAERHPKVSLTCSGLDLLNTFEEFPSAENFGFDSGNKPVFKVHGREYTDFCVSYECDPDEEVWAASADFCQPVNITYMYHQLGDRLPSKEFCCGEGAVMNVSPSGKRTCLDSETLEKVPVQKSSFNCGSKTKEKVSILREDELNDDDDTLKCVS